VYDKYLTSHEESWGKEFCISVSR